MKTKKTQIPTLLGTGSQSIWRLRVETKQHWCEMTFSDRQLADAEYQRIRAQGIFGNAWVTEITLEEQRDGN